MIKKTVLTLSFIASSLLAVQPTQVKKKQVLNANNYYINTKNNIDKSSTFSGSSEGIVQKGQKSLDTFTDTTIITDIETHKNPSTIAQAQNSVFLANNKNYQSRLAKLMKEQMQKKSKKAIDNILNVRGYCRVENIVKVFASDQFGELSCDLRNMKTKKIFHSQIFVKFMPDYQREMLIAFPVYANINSIRYDATGYFLNATKTSLNIADKIDSVTIKKLLLKGMLVESDIAYKQAMAYMSAIKNSQTSSQTTYVTDAKGNTIPIQSSKTQRPKARDYINTGIVQSIAAIIHLLGENSLYKLRPLFTVNKGDIFYTEMIFKNQNVFNKMQNMIKQENQNINNNNNAYKQDLMKNTMPNSIVKGN